MIHNYFLDSKQAEKTFAQMTHMAIEHPTIQVQLQTLFARVCLTCNPISDFELKDITNQIDEVATTLIGLPPHEAKDVDPLLLIEIAKSCNEQGLSVPALDELLSKIAAELAQQPDTVKKMGRVRHISTLLQNNGLAVHPVSAPRAIKKQLQEIADWLTLPESELIELVDHCCADLIALDQDQSQILALIAIGELRNNNFHVACKLLRLVIEQGLISAEAQEALNFVAIQRRQNGAYGFTNPLQDEVDSPEKLALNFFLPMTINAIWLFNLYAKRVSSSGDQQEVA